MLIIASGAVPAKLGAGFASGIAWKQKDRALKATTSSPDMLLAFANENVSFRNEGVSDALIKPGKRAKESDFLQLSLL